MGTRLLRRVLRHDGARVRVRELRSPGAERSFVLVHGIGVSSRYLEPLAAALHAHGDVMLVDLPGFGGLPRPSRPLSIEGFANLLDRVVREEGLPAPVLIGHSMGAQVVVDALARLRPQDTHAVLIGPPVNPAEPGLGQVTARFVQSARHETARMQAIAARSYLRCGPAWFLEVLPSMMRYPISGRLAEVGANTLVLRGEHDLVAPADWAEAAAALLPRGRAATIPGVAHNAVWDRPEEVAALILAHLGLDARPDGGALARAAREPGGLDAALPGDGPPLGDDGPAVRAGTDDVPGARLEPADGPSAVVKAVAWAADYAHAGIWAVRSWADRAPAWARTPGDPGRPTVLLIPGIYESWRVLGGLGAALAGAGYRVRGAPLGRNSADLADSAAAVLAQLERHRAHRVILVAHSKGGLIGHDVLLARPDLVAGLVCVSTPFSGSSRARWLPLRAIRALLPGALGAHAAHEVERRITSIGVTWDPHVPEGSALPGATNVTVPMLGHFRPLTDPRVIEQVLAAVGRYADEPAD